MEKTSQQISELQAEKLIDIYNQYKHIFSSATGKVRGYQCEINFKAVSYTHLDVYKRQR